MWGSNSRPRHQESQAPPTEPAKLPKTDFLTIKKDNSSVSKHLNSNNGTQKINLKILKLLREINCQTGIIDQSKP